MDTGAMYTHEHLAKCETVKGYVCQDCRRWFPGCQCGPLRCPKGCTANVEPSHDPRSN